MRRSPRKNQQTEEKNVPYIFPDDISRLITSYVPDYELLPWIDEKKLKWSGLSANTNPGAISLLKEHPEKINWTLLSENQSPEAIKLLEKYPEKINWTRLSGNPYA